MAGKKKISLIAGSFVLVAAVVACVVAVVVSTKSSSTTSSSSPAQPNTASTSASVKAIKSICQPTGFRETCEEALTKAVGNNTDIKSLIKTSLEVTITHIRDAANRSSVLHAAAEDPTTYLPLQTCMTVFDYAVQDLKDAVDHVLNYQLNDLDRAVYDLKNWLSSASTYQETCVDEFNNQTSDAAVAMKAALNRSMELTANAISIVHQVGSMVSEFKLPSIGSDGGGSNSRRLMSVDEEGYPSWLSAGRRRLLQLDPLHMKPTVTVAQDGSGQFKSINEGLAALPRNNKDYVVLYVKEGVYKEQVSVDSDLNMLVLVGDGPTKTRVSGNLNVAKGGGLGTWESATFGMIPNYMHQIPNYIRCIYMFYVHA